MQIPIRPYEMIARDRPDSSIAVSGTVDDLPNREVETQVRLFFLSLWGRAKDWGRASPQPLKGILVYPKGLMILPGELLARLLEFRKSRARGIPRIGELPMGDELFQVGPNPQRGLRGFAFRHLERIPEPYC